MQHLGLVAIIIFTVSSSLLLFTREVSGKLTLSLHAAQTDRAHRMYALSELLVALLTTLFIVNWLTPYYSLGSVYTLTMLTGMVCLAITAWVPHRENIFALIHLTSANAFAVCLFISNLYLTFSSKFSQLTIGILAMCSLIMLSVFILGSLSLKRSKNSTLYLQLLFFEAFIVSILAVTYLG